MQRRYLSTQSHASNLTLDGQPMGALAWIEAAPVGVADAFGNAGSAGNRPPPVNNVSWKTAVSGDWNTSADWTGGVVPGSSNDVTIGVAGAYTVTISTGQSAHSLTISDAAATVADNAGALALGTKLSLTAGTLALSNAGGISGGSLTIGTGTTLLSDGTSTISSSVTSTGLISVSAGDLILGGGGALGGTLSGAGSLELTGGTAFTIGAAGLAGSGNLADLGAALNFTASGTVSDSVALGGNGTLSASAGKDGTISGALTIGEPAATYSGDGYLLGAGTLTTTGVTTVADYSGNAELFLGSGLTWVNGGTVNDGGYGFLNNVGSDTVTIVNQAGASFNFTSDDANLVQYNGGTDTFTNAGTLAKTGGTGISLLGAAVNSTGVITVASGVLDLTDGGTLGGVLNGPGTLELSGGVFSVGASGVSGAGAMQVLGATLNFSGSGTVSDSVAVGGNGTLSASAGKDGTISGALTIGEPAATYSGDGYLLGAGTLTTTGVTTVADYSSNAELFLGSGLTWVNGGTVNDGGYGYLNNVGSDTVTIVNQAGANFNFTTDDANLVQYNGGTDTFTNAGTLAKTGGTGTSTLQAAVNSTGVILVASGVLDLTDGGSIGGTVSGAGTVELGGGSFAAGGGIAGSGNLVITGAALNFSGSGTVTAAVAVNGNGTLSVGAGVHTTLSGPLTIGTPSATYNGDGYLTGPGTLTTSGVTTIVDYSTNAELFLGSGITWVNSGTVNDGGYGYLNNVGSDSVTIVNQAGASFNLTSDDANLVPYNGGIDSFTNAGTLAKTGGSGTSALYLAMTNSGTISAASGTLQLESTLANTGLLLATNGGVLDLSPTTISNITGTTLAGGAYEADAGSIIELSSNATITTDSANITLSGVGSSIQAFNGSTQVTLDSTLSSITTNGTLNLLNGRNFTVAANGGTLSLAGLLNLGGVNFTATKLAIASAGTAAGYGTIAGAVTDAGTISASGGTLVLSGAVTGAGALRAAAASTVELTKGGALTEAISGAGTLELHGATAYTLAGATVAISTTQIDAGATLSGTGTLTGSVADAGTLTATGGSLTVDGALTGAGAVQIAAASVLDLAGGGSFAGGVSGAGTLKLDGSNPFIMQAGATLTAATVLVDAGATLDLNSGGALTGTISGAGTLQLDGATPYTVAAGTPFNFGAVVVDAGAKLDLNIGGALTGNIGGAGSLELGGPIAYTLGGVTESIAALSIDTGTTLSGNGVISGSVADAGTLAASGGVLTIDGAVTGAGALQAAAGATLDLLSGGNISGNVSGAGTLQLDGASALVLQSAANLTVAKVIVDAGSTLDLTKGGALGGTITGAGTLQLDGATAYTLAAGTTLPIGTVAVDAGATLSGAGILSSALFDSGTVSASAGTLLVDGAVSGAGTLSAATGNVLDLAGGGTFAGKVSGTGTLKLDGATAFTLAGANVSISSVTVDAGATLAGNGTVSGSITDSGTIVASGGKLVLSGAIGGTGTMQALAGATLDLTAGGVLAQAISGAGTLELGGAYTLGAHVPTVAALKIDAGASLSGIGKINGAIADSGTVAAVGGTLTLAGALSGTGTASAASGALLLLSGGGSFGGAITGAGTVDIGSALTLTGAASLSAANVIETANLTLSTGVSLTIGAGDDFAMTAAAGKTVKLTGKGTDSVTNMGSLAANGVGTADVNLAFLNSANVSVGSGTLAFLKAVTNNGTIDTAGTTSFKAVVAGTGTLDVEATGTLSLLAGASVGQTVDFLAGTGLVDLTKPIDFLGTIAGFGGSDQIDLVKTLETSYNFSGGVLTVMDGGKVEASINFSGSGYSNATLMLGTDHNGGTLITFL